MEGCGKWVTDLRGQWAGTHPRGFPGLGSHGRGFWEGQGVCIADDPDCPLRSVTHFPHPSMGHPIPEEFPDDSGFPLLRPPFFGLLSTDCWPLTALYPTRPIPASSFVLPPGPKTPSTHGTENSVGPLCQVDYLIFSDVSRRCVGAVAGRQRQRALPDSGGGLIG
jgi:hypothetical protein